MTEKHTTAPTAGPYADYGSWLRQKRTEHLLSQEALGRLVEVDGTYINRIEQGRVKVPYAPLRLRIHAIFGTSESDPDFLPILSPADRRQALRTERSTAQSVGERVDRLLATATPDQQHAIETILRALEALIGDEG
jgi:Predicted transcriptional regulators